MISVAELLLEQGRQAADTRRRAGDTSAQLWSSLGNTAASAIANAAKSRDEAPRRALQDEALGLQVGEQKRGVQARSILGRIVGSTPHVDEDGVSLYDVPTITSKLEAEGYGDHVGDVATQLKGLNDAFRQERQAKVSVAQRGAQALLQAGGDQELTTHFLDTLEKNGTFGKGEIDTYRQMIAADPSKIPVILRQFAGPAKVVMGAPGATPIDELTGKPVGPTLPKDKPQPTEASLAAAAAVGDTTAAGAMKLLKPTPPETRSLQLQANEALKKGDTAEYNRIMRTMRDSAAAGKVANPLADEMAQARLAALRDKAQPLDVTPDISTTAAGRTFVDLSLYSAAERDKARQAATAAGAVPVSKEQANALQEINNAKRNQRDIMNQIDDALPRGPGGRAVASVTVPLQKVLQTNDQIAAFNSWRTAAIQTLRATAGSKGLRINQAEIAQAIENDIPKLTDTIGTAQQKVKNINTLLENAERSILERDARETPPAPPAAIPLTPGLSRLRDR